MQAPPSRPPSRPSSASVASSSRSTLARARTQGRQSHAAPALASQTTSRPSMPTPAGRPTAPEPTPMHGSYRYASQQHEQRPNAYHHHSYTCAGPGVRVKVEDGPAPAAPHRFPSYPPGEPSRAMDPASQQQQWAYDDDALVPLSPRSRPSGLLPLQQVYPQQNQMSMQVAMHGAVQMQMTQMSFFQVPPGYYPGPLNAQQFGPGTAYGQYPPDGRFYNPSPQPAYPMYSAPNMRSAPPAATSKNSNKENDDDGYPVHQCPKCEKQYRGKHARSIWRRHLQDKHGIPLSMQVRRSRWDADPNRPANSQEKRERMLESKRRWAAKKRSERRAAKARNDNSPDPSEQDVELDEQQEREWEHQMQLEAEVEAAEANIRPVLGSRRRVQAIQPVEQVPAAKRKRRSSSSTAPMLRTLSLGPAQAMSRSPSRNGSVSGATPLAPSMTRSSSASHMSRTNSRNTPVVLDAQAVDQMAPAHDQQRFEPGGLSQSAHAPQPQYPVYEYEMPMPPPRAQAQAWSAVPTAAEHQDAQDYSALLPVAEDAAYYEQVEDAAPELGDIPVIPIPAIEDDAAACAESLLIMQSSPLRASPVAQHAELQPAIELSFRSTEDSDKRASKDLFVSAGVRGSSPICSPFAVEKRHSRLTSSDGDMPEDADPSESRIMPHRYLSQRADTTPTPLRKVFSLGPDRRSLKRQQGSSALKPAPRRTSGSDFDTDDPFCPPGFASSSRGAPSSSAKTRDSPITPLTPNHTLHNSRSNTLNGVRARPPPPPFPRDAWAASSKESAVAPTPSKFFSSTTLPSLPTPLQKSTTADYRSLSQTPFNRPSTSHVTPRFHPSSPHCWQLSSPNGLSLTHSLGLAPSAPPPETPGWAEMLSGGTPDNRLAQIVKKRQREIPTSAERGQRASISLLRTDDSEDD